MASNRKPRRRTPDVPALPSARERPPTRPRNVYIAFAAIAVGTAVVTVLYPNVDVIDKFGPNLATEAIGILLTLVFVQRFLDRQERIRRMRGSIGALRKGGRALTHMASVWSALVKGGYRRVPQHPPESVDSFFATHITENLGYIDPARMRNSEEGEERWIDWATRELLDAQRALHDIIIAYGSSLDATYVEAVDELVDDPFPRRLADIANTPTIDVRSWRVALNAGRALREAHFARLLTALELHNELAREAAGVRSRRSAPRTGSIGVELPLDWDLRARFVVDDGWWRTDPRPGTLCADGDRRPVAEAEAS